MSVDPMAPVWQRLDNEPAVFYAGRPEAAFVAAKDRLIELGFVRATEPARIALCQSCGDGHLARIQWVEDQIAGTRRAFIPCPTCGLVAIDPERLRRWDIDISRLVSGVVATIGGRGTVQEVVRGRLWFLGCIPSLGRRYSAYFARTVCSHERPAVLAALTSHPRAVLFHPTEHSVRSWEGRIPNPAIALESVVALGPDGLTVDAAAIEGRLTDSGLGAPKVRAPQRREQRAAGIESLVKELREWLRGARSHAHATAELGTTAPPLGLDRARQLLAGRRVAPGIKGDRQVRTVGADDRRHLGRRGHPRLPRHVAAFRRRCADTAGEFTEFVKRWWSRHGTMPVITGDLFDLARDCLESVLSAETEDGKRKQLGRFLKKQRDRVVGTHRVREAVDDTGNASADHAGRPRYTLEQICKTPQVLREFATGGHF